MKKADVISEIRRLAATSGGTPPGLRLFCVETGLREHEIVGRMWPRWGDALAEAGFPINAMNPQMDEDELLGRYATLARRLGHLPTSKEVRFEATASQGFPHPTTFTRRYGGMAQVRDRVRAWCEANPGNEDVLEMCPPALPESDEAPESTSAGTRPPGSVYLIRSGRDYKIGRSNDAGRREYEIRLQMPDPVLLVWEIKTDDPEGVEAYWHRRFSDRRKGGEWFDLRKADIDAFKRWRRIF